jgi:putative membrane protein
MARSNVTVAVGAVAVLVGAGCAGKDGGAKQEPISENLAPAVASPTTEAFVPPGRTISGGYQADPTDTASTAPMYEQDDDKAVEETSADKRGVRETRYTFVPVVTRQGVATITPLPSAVPEPQIASTGLTDGQIVKIAETMQNAELAEARVVAERAQNARVKEFAVRLQQDNQRLKQSTEALAKSQNLTPTESPVSADVRVKASQELTSVELAPAGEFDKAFIDAQVQENQQMLELLNARLIPAASEPKLKDELTQSRAVLERQGAEAKTIQRTLETAPR